MFIREPDPFAPFQDERAVYHDDINDYATNEPTMEDAVEDAVDATFRLLTSDVRTRGAATAW